MTLTNPTAATKRTDLPWLRQRAVPRQPTTALADHATTPGVAPVIEAPATSRVSTSLDLGAPVPEPPATPAKTPSMLDLTLSDEPAPAIPAAERSTARPAARSKTAPARRARPGHPEILTQKAPTVELTAVQSGVGALSITAACSDEVGDIRIGCVYQLRTTGEGIVQPAGGPDTAPATSHQPLIRHDRDRFETLTVDLRQSRELERLVVLLYSATASEPLRWGGTLLIETSGDSRIEVPLERPSSPGVLAALSIYNINGRYVLRAEQQLTNGPVREACAAFGFNRITWLDDRTPLT